MNKVHGERIARSYAYWEEQAQMKQVRDEHVQKLVALKRQLDKVERYFPQVEYHINRIYGPGAN